MNKSEAYWQAINDALANPVFKNALTSAQVVNAATNVDPSSIFSHYYLVKIMFLLLF